MFRVSAKHQRRWRGPTQTPVLVPMEVPKGNQCAHALAISGQNKREHNVASSTFRPTTSMVAKNNLTLGATENTSFLRGPKGECKSRADEAQNSKIAVILSSSSLLSTKKEKNEQTRALQRSWVNSPAAATRAVRETLRMSAALHIPCIENDAKTTDDRVVFLPSRPPHDPLHNIRT